MSKSKASAPKPGTIQHAAARIGVSIPTVYKLIHQGRLRTFKIGRARRVTEEAIGECVAALEAQSAQL